MANFSRKFHLAWLVIVVLSVANFVLACQAGLANSRLLLLTEGISLALICSVAVQLAYQHRLLQRQLTQCQLNEHDYLTGLFSRQSFIEKIASAVRDAQVKGEQLSLLLLDVDGFKGINDRCGADFCDNILRRIAVMIQGSIRGWDTASRFGGDEFCVLLPSTSGIDAVAVAERLRAHIAASPVDHAEGEVCVTVSIGVACLCNDITTSEALLAKANQCLADGKRIGGNQVIVDWDIALEAIEA